jgi:hypothetical protein
LLADYNVELKPVATNPEVVYLPSTQPSAVAPAPTTQNKSSTDNSSAPQGNSRNEDTEPAQPEMLVKQVETTKEAREAGNTLATDLAPGQQGVGASQTDAAPPQAAPDPHQPAESSDQTNVPLLIYCD